MVSILPPSHTLSMNMMNADDCVVVHLRYGNISGGRLMSVTQEVVAFDIKAFPLVNGAK